MPCDYKKNYPAKWKTFIRPTILKRADNPCEFCGIENYAIGYRDGDEFHIEDGEKYIPDSVHEKKLIKIVLTIAHLNHDTTDNDGMEYEADTMPLWSSNLAALCQKCHNNHDRPFRDANRKSNRENPAQMTIFDA